MFGAAWPSSAHVQLVGHCFSAVESLCCFREPSQLEKIAGSPCHLACLDAWSSPPSFLVCGSMHCCLETCCQVVGLGLCRTLGSPFGAYGVEMGWSRASFSSRSCSKANLARLQHSSVSRGIVRRQRTGPNNSGHRNVLHHLHHHGVDIATARDRLAWQSLEHDWLAAHGLPVDRLPGANIFPVSTESFLWEKRCLKGSFHGQQVFACDVSDPGYAITLELDRFSGWRGQRGDQSIAALLQNVADTGWIRPGTFHVKMLLFARQFPSERLSGLLALTPFCFDAFSAPCIVAEISMLPVVWLGDMTRLATELGRWTAKLSLARLQQDAELPERAMEREIGEVGCCDSRMAERIHWWIDRWLELCFLEWLQCLQWSSHHNCWM